MSINYKSSHYEIIDDFAHKHFWFAARNALLRSILLKYFPKPSGKSFLEVGCGNGVVIRELEELGFDVTGIDINQAALNYAKIGTHARLIRKSFLTYDSQKRYKAVGMFDVLEHQRGDADFINKSYSFVAPGGFLFLTVPASMKLWSEIDTLSGHQRRYELKNLTGLVKKAGFSVVYANYWQVLTLPFYFLWRLKWRFSNRTEIRSYIKAPPFFINRLLLYLLKLELRFQGTVNYPFGASIILVARKNNKKID